MWRIQAWVSRYGSARVRFTASAICSRSPALRLRHRARASLRAIVAVLAATVATVVVPEAIAESVVAVLRNVIITVSRTF
jgi:hypothetical protein